MNENHAKRKSVALLGPIYKSSEQSVLFDRVYGDSRRLLQIIVNFVNNAVKFTEAEGHVSVLLDVTHVHAEPSSREEEKAYLVDAFRPRAAPDKHSKISSGANCGSAPDKSIIEDNELDSSESELEHRVQFTYSMTIKDTGIGISKQDQARLFKNFGKLD